MSITAGPYGQTTSSAITTTPTAIYTPGAAIPTASVIEVTNTGVADIYVYVVGLHGTDAAKGPGKGARIFGSGTPGFPNVKSFKLGLTNNALGAVYISMASGTSDCDWTFQGG